MNKKFNTGSYILMVLLGLMALYGLFWTVVMSPSMYGGIEVFLISSMGTILCVIALVGIVKRHKIGVIFVKVISGVLIAFALWHDFTGIYTLSQIKVEGGLEMIIGRYFLGLLIGLGFPLLLSYLAHKENQRLKKLK